MNLLGYRAFSTELLKIATEVRDADIRAMIAESNGKEYLNGGALRTNAEAETNFKPKLAEIIISETPKEKLWSERGTAIGAGLGGIAGHLVGSRADTPVVHGAFGAAGLGVGGFLGSRIGKHLGQRHDKKHPPKVLGHFVSDVGSEKTAGFMGYAPPSTYNFRGKKPTGQGTAYETASNFAATGLKGAMTGAGVGSLTHALRGGHGVAPHLGKWVAGGAGIALADRALRRHSVMTQKQAMFSPARQLHSTQSTGGFENKVHNTPLKAPAATIGRDFRLPPQGV